MHVHFTLKILQLIETLWLKKQKNVTVAIGVVLIMGAHIHSLPK